MGISEIMEVATQKISSLDELREVGVEFSAKDMWGKTNARISLKWLMKDAGLSKKLRDVMELRAKGYKDAKIAEMLGVKRSAITIRKLRAIKMMREILKK